MTVYSRKSGYFNTFFLLIITCLFLILFFGDFDKITRKQQAIKIKNDIVFIVDRTIDFRIKEDRWPRRIDEIKESLLSRLSLEEILKYSFEHSLSGEKSMYLKRDLFDSNLTIRQSLSYISKTMGLCGPDKKSSYKTQDGYIYCSIYKESP